MTGWIGLGIGIWTDLAQPDWWVPLSFIKNAASSLAGFLIGAPVALTALASIAEDRERRMEIERVNDATRTAWGHFRDTVRSFCNQQRMEALFHLTLVVQESKDSIAQLLKDYSDKSEQYNDLSIFEEELSSRVTRLNQMHYQASEIIGYAEYIAIYWAQVVGAWNTLDLHIRPQRDRLRLEWFDRDTDAQLRNRLSIQQQPLREFLHLHLHDSGGAGITTMAEFRRHISTLTPPDGSNPENTAVWFTLTSIMYTKEKVADYYEKALAAGSELSELEDACDAIEAQDWPTAFTVQKS